MLGRFLRTHRAIYADRERIYRAAMGGDSGLSSPWLIVGAGLTILAALDLWLFAGVPLLDDTITPYVPWNILVPQIVIWMANVVVITAVLALFGAPTSPLVIARLWAYVMGHVSTVVPPVMVLILAVRSLLLDASTIELPATLMFIVVSLALVVWMFGALRAVDGRRTFPAVVAVAAAFCAGAAIGEAKRRWISHFEDVERGSMRPGFDRGDRILVSGLTLMMREPRPGDVVVYSARRERHDEVRSYVHRVVAGPGDRVRFVDCGAIVNDRAAKAGEAVRSENPGLRTPAWVMPEVLGFKLFITTFDNARDSLCHREEAVVPAGHYFVAGDARDRSIDSRFPLPGFIPRAAITGIAVSVHSASGRSRRL